MRTHRLVGIALAAALVLPVLATGTAGATTPATYVTRGSVEQVFVIHATPGAAIELHDSTDALLQSGTVDSLGGFIFHNVTPGTGDTTVEHHDSVTEQSAPITVLAPDAVPPQSLYTGQTLPAPGYGYLTTRDGTTLGVQVALPGPANGGPYPTLVEYSGYDPSNPANSANLFKTLATALGYAYVGVNIRGTGCSGGAFDYFEQLQSLDGYDMIETIAAQPWADRVGMVGISYPGISQLFVAQTRPPHLAAITPLSVIDDTFRSTLYPGGIFNDGFALGWATDRMNSNKWPGGTGWVTNRVNEGDTQCAENVSLRAQNRDLLGAIQSHEFYPAVGDPVYPPGGDALAPYSFVDKIDAPVFVAGAWQDEQTGGHWPDMLDRFTSVPKGELKITAQNGTHADSLDPDILPRMLEFLDFYVARRVPAIPPTVRAAAPTIYKSITGVDGLQFPPDRFAGQTDFAAALARFEAEPPVRVLWENGGQPGGVPGAPFPAGESSYSQWPPAQTQATPFYLEPDGRLGPKAPTVADDAPGSSASYVSDASARPRADYSGSSNGIWLANASYDWEPPVDGKALAFVTDPLTASTTMLGTGSVDLWVKSTAADTDVQVTLSEVRPDGTERYVQNGWLRASHRKLDSAGSTELKPRQTHLQTDAAPLPAGEYTPIRIELFPFGYVFRAGSRVRLSIEAPGGDRPLWTFDTLDAAGTTTNSIAHSIGRPSRVVLPLAPTPADLPASPAPCPSLRAEPCRTYTGVNPPPDVFLVSGPKARMGQEHATFVFTATPGATARCSLDFQALAPCSSPYRVRHVGIGTHTAIVIAQDGAGRHGNVIVDQWRVVRH